MSVTWIVNFKHFGQFSSGKGRHGKDLKNLLILKSEKRFFGGNE
jgi:hypothetical protein